MGLSTLQLDKKHLQKRHRIFRRDREPSRIPARTHNILTTRAKVREFVFVVYEWICLSIISFPDLLRIKPKARSGQIQFALRDHLSGT